MDIPKGLAAQDFQHLSACGNEVTRGDDVSLNLRGGYDGRDDGSKDC